MPQQTRNLTGAVGADSKAERSLIAAKAGSGSTGVQSTNSSRGFGSGAGASSFLRLKPLMPLTTKNTTREIMRKLSMFCTKLP